MGIGAGLELGHRRRQLLLRLPGPGLARVGGCGLGRLLLGEMVGHEPIQALHDPAGGLPKKPDRHQHIAQQRCPAREEAHGHHGAGRGGGKARDQVELLERPVLERPLVGHEAALDPLAEPLLPAPGKKPQPLAGVADHPAIRLQHVFRHIGREPGATDLVEAFGVGEHRPHLGEGEIVMDLVDDGPGPVGHRSGSPRPPACAQAGEST